MANLSNDQAALVVAIAKANGHPAPEEWAAKVDAEYEPPEPPPPQETKQSQDEAQAAIKKLSDPV